MKAKRRETPAVPGTPSTGQPVPTHGPFVVYTSGAGGDFIHMVPSRRHSGERPCGGGARLHGPEVISLGLFLNGFNGMDFNWVNMC